jgi:hypothetical protein
MDMKPINERPKLGLPGASPAPAPKPKAIEPLDVAEQLFHGAMRDDVLVTATFFDGNEITGRPLAIGRYSFLIGTPDGQEVAVFKASLRSLCAQKETAG